MAIAFAVVCVALLGGAPAIVAAYLLGAHDAHVSAAEQAALAAGEPPVPEAPLDLTLDRVVA